MLDGRTTTQSRILAEIEAHGSYRCRKPSELTAARHLNAKGLIRRDRKDGYLWHHPARLAAAEGGVR
ncbi:hypothetical protein M728_000365 [Ensifer sp. WSM1721]|uniref:hypothetical protein n=1 Tax=Ensifer sp. WSM1721 TaxID=1041159 RepID=UPI00047E6CE6|nr:hypothetical protein [Ensifer sp. WSM1721]